MPQAGVVSTSKNTYKQQNTEPSVKEMPSIAEMYPTSLEPISPSSVPTINNKHKITFRVQLAASTQKSNLKEGIWASVKGVECLKVGASYKVLVGTHPTLNAAVQQQQHWRKNGFKDAFIVAFRNGQRISMTEAVRS